LTFYKWWVLWPSAIMHYLYPARLILSSCTHSESYPSDQDSYPIQFKIIMVRFPPFEIEQWINEYEFVPNVLDLASSCAAPTTLKELSDLSTDNATTNLIEFPDPLLYGDPHGSRKLRQTIAENLGDNPLTKSDVLTADNVLVTQGGIAANFAVYQSLLNPGDHVVCVYPTFQQLYSVPAALGAEVSLWKLKKDKGYVPDVPELNHLVKSNTKVKTSNRPD
jgi:DNA-binding transcriptional MocR family regulator